MTPDPTGQDSRVPASTDPASLDADPCCEAAEMTTEQLYRYLDGALTPEDVEQVRAHLAECPDCLHQQELEMLIRSAVRRCCQEKAPEQLRATILSRITEVSATTVSTTTVTWHAGGA